MYKEFVFPWCLLCSGVPFGVSFPDQIDQLLHANLTLNDKVKNDLNREQLVMMKQKVSLVKKGLCSQLKYLTDVLVNDNLRHVVLRQE